MPEQTGGVPLAARLVAVCLLSAAVVHFAVTFLWNAPTNPVKAELRSEITSYIEPFFWQNWSLFAPNPVNADSEVLVRADVRDPDTGEFETTEWVSATRLEWKLVEANPFPPRSTRLSANLYRRLSSAWYDLNVEQRDVVADDFFTIDDDWAQLKDALEQQTDDDVSASDIDEMAHLDQVATAYATQVAIAIWGVDLSSVQVEIRRTPVPRWDDRFEDFDPDSSFVRTFGWRPLFTFDGQDDTAFADYLDMLEKS